LLHCLGDVVNLVIGVLLRIDKESVPEAHESVERLNVYSLDDLLSRFLGFFLTSLLFLNSSLLLLLLIELLLFFLFVFMLFDLDLICILLFFYFFLFV
jgi:hypothetical protein